MGVSISRSHALRPAASVSPDITTFNDLPMNVKHGLRLGEIWAAPVTEDPCQYRRRRRRESALPGLQPVRTVRIAAALVSPNGHMRIRRQPDFVDRIFLFFKLERHDHAHPYGIRHHCCPLARDAGLRAGSGSPL